jgi:AcrR family transcriptional regulator
MVGCTIEYKVTGKSNRLSMRDTAKDSIEARERILYSAKKEFATKGFEGARMGAIAKRAKVNQALIHYYFKNKGNLYKQVLHRLFGIEHAKIIQENVEQWDFMPSESLYIAIYLIVNIHLEALDPDLNKIIAREVAEERMYLKSFVRDHIIPQLELLEDVIIRGVEAGDFLTRNPLMSVLELIVFVMSYVSNRAMYVGTQWYERLYGKNSKEELFQFVLEHTFKALCPKNKKPVIPQVHSSIIKSLDMLIGDIKKKQNWEANQRALSE